MNVSHIRRLSTALLCCCTLSSLWSVDVADPGLPQQIAAMDAKSARAWLVEIGWLRGEVGKEWLQYVALAESSDAVLAALSKQTPTQDRLLTFGLNATGLTLSRLAERTACRERLHRDGTLLEAIRLCAGMAGKTKVSDAGEGYSAEDLVRVRAEMLSGGPLPVGASAKQRTQLMRLRLFAGAAFGMAGLNGEEADVLMREMGGYSTTTYDADGMRQLRVEKFAHLDATCMSALATALASGNAQQRGSALQIRAMTPAAP